MNNKVSIETQEFAIRKKLEFHFNRVQEVFFWATDREYHNILSLGREHIFG